MAATILNDIQRGVRNKQLGAQRFLRSTSDAARNPCSFNIVLLPRWTTVLETYATHRESHSVAEAGDETYML